jgi:hypothetical protein
LAPHVRTGRELFNQLHGSAHTSHILMSHENLDFSGANKTCNLIAILALQL